MKLKKHQFNLVQSTRTKHGIWNLFLSEGLFSTESKLFFTSIVRALYKIELEKRANVIHGFKFSNLGKSMTGNNIFIHKG